LAGKLELWRQLFFFLWRNGSYLFSYFQLFILDGAQGGGKKEKENYMGSDFMTGLTFCVLTS